MLGGDGCLALGGDGCLALGGDGGMAIGGDGDGGLALLLTVIVVLTYGLAIVADAG